MFWYLWYQKWKPSTANINFTSPQLNPWLLTVTIFLIKITEIKLDSYRLNTKSRKGGKIHMQSFRSLSQRRSKCHNRQTNTIAHMHSLVCSAKQSKKQNLKISFLNTCCLVLKKDKTPKQLKLTWKNETDAKKIVTCFKWEADSAYLSEMHSIQ